VTETELEVTAQLAGPEEKDVDITLSGGVLTIRGETARSAVPL
jgi:HSP20 family molecular chaperone IbpA